MKRQILAGLVAMGMLLGAGSAIAAPSNDDIEDATVIASIPFTEMVSTVGAGLESNEPQPCGFIGSTVWYRFTSTIEGVLIAHTFGSDFDTALAVYSGSLFDPYRIACNTDALGRASRVGFYVDPGQTYYFQAGGESGREGNLTFSLTQPASLEGRVIDAGDGDPVPDICIDVFSLEHTWIGTGTTDREGDYSIRLLPEGRAKVRFTDCQEGAYARQWYSGETSFASADEVLLVGGATAGAVDVSLGVRPGPDLAVLEVVVRNVPLDVADTEVPAPTTYNRDVEVRIANSGPLAGRRVIVHAEACPRTVGSCKILGDKRLGRIEPGQQASTVFDWNAIDTIGDVSLFISVFGTRDMDWDDNVVESERNVWLGGTGFGARLCSGSGPCLPT